MRQTAPYWIDPLDTSYLFPDVNLALDEPNGLIAIGGDLSPKRIVAAYCHGIFPWYSDNQPILWWSPDPRALILVDQYKASRSLRKKIKKGLYHVTMDTVFRDVIVECSKPRPTQQGTWITQDMIEAYCELHLQGYAHSVEVWQDKKLVGGLYGLSLGCAFFGESMFSRVSDASKIALYFLLEFVKQWQFTFIDCQVSSSHVASLGAMNVARPDFIEMLGDTLKCPDQKHTWRFDSTA